MWLADMKLVPQAASAAVGAAAAGDTLVLRDGASERGLTLEKHSVLGVLFALASMCGNRPESPHSCLFLYPALGLLL